MNDKELNNLEKGTEFEKIVRNTLVSKGLNVSGEQILGHKKVDLCFEKKDFSKVYKYAVECKNKKDKLTKDDVLTIINDYSSLFDCNLIDKLLIVTSSGVAPSVMTYIDNKRNVEHITYDELLNSTIDFSQYLKLLIHEFECSSDGLDRYYIDIHVKENQIRNDKTTDLYRIISSWINATDSNPVAILGSYGQGKTSFARFLSYKLALFHIENQQERIPIYIKLNLISKEQSLEGLLGKIFTTTGLIKNYDFMSFSQLNNLGRFVIILDGFDEMKHSLSWEEFKYNFSQLNRLVCDNSKVILLGRPNVFINDDEYNLTLKGIRKSPLGIIKEPNWPNYHELEIASLTTEQIQIFFDKYYNYKICHAKDKKEYSKFTHAKNYKTGKITDERIREISSRPVQLKMLADLLPYTSTCIEDITTPVLFNEFIDLILEREYEKETKLNISKKDRRKFSSLIAFYLWENSNEYSIKCEDIPDDFFVQFMPKHLPKDETPEKIKRDLISGCFLSRKMGNTIYFPHKSFQEFFIAEEILQIFSKDTSISLDKIDSLLTNEVCEFLYGLSGINDIVNIHRHIANYKGALSLKFLKLYIREDCEIFVSKNLNITSPWYSLIRALMIGEFHCWNRDTEFINFLISCLKITSYIDTVFVVFLSLYKNVHAYEKILCELSKLYLKEMKPISEKEKSSKEISKKTRKTDIEIEMEKNMRDIRAIFQKINISKKAYKLDLLGLLHTCVTVLEKWCIVSEWRMRSVLKDKFYVTVNVQLTTIELILQVQNSQLEE